MPEGTEDSDRETILSDILKSKRSQVIKEGAVRHLLGDILEAQNTTNVLLLRLIEFLKIHR